jgi:hypothetical protein
MHARFDIISIAILDKHIGTLHTDHMHARMILFRVGRGSAIAIPAKQISTVQCTDHINVKVLIIYSRVVWSIGWVEFLTFLHFQQSTPDFCYIPSSTENGKKNLLTL